MTPTTPTPDTTVALTIERNEWPLSGVWHRVESWLADVEAPIPAGPDGVETGDDDFDGRFDVTPDDGTAERVLTPSVREGLLGLDELVGATRDRWQRPRSPPPDWANDSDRPAGDRARGGRRRGVIAATTGLPTEAARASSGCHGFAAERYGIP